MIVLENADSTFGAQSEAPYLARTLVSQGTVPADYATRHNPSVYFHSIIDSPVCAQNDVPLTRLAADLAAPHGTPN